MVLGHRIQNTAEAAPSHGSRNNPSLPATPIAPSVLSVRNAG
jgi:hypothetical protein